jgi:hypothetical protein
MLLYAQEKQRILSCKKNCLFLICTIFLKLYPLIVSINEFGQSIVSEGSTMNYNDIFHYSEGHLYWKASADSRVKIGEVAGFRHSQGYIAVSVGSKLMLAHRVIWEMMIGEIPNNMEIDHLDNCRINNKIENLRLVTRTENLKNKGMYKSNTSGVTGVALNKEKNKWCANIRINGKLKHLGYHDDFNSACEARYAAERHYGFHQDHGKARGNP